jgi:hypothetical protein
MALLERLYTAFDAITAAHGLFKVSAQLGCVRVQLPRSTLTLAPLADARCATL